MADKPFTMPAHPFVIPRIVRLPICDGHWIDVKQELSIGEVWDMYAQMRAPIDDAGPRRVRPGEIDPARIGRARFQAWILAWSLVDPDGTPIDITDGNIGQLKPAVYQRIADVLDAHEDAVTQTQDAEKNDPAGAIVSGPILSSAG